MPVGHVAWLGEVPEVTVCNRLLLLLEEYTNEEIDDFSVIAKYCPNLQDNEKVIICKSELFLSVQNNGILVLIPDGALNIRKLISMWDADTHTINTLSLDNIISVMST